jgi:hypothetical protein
MAVSTWSPESLGIPSRQNFLLWKDMERAYEFIENNARFSISGNVHGFLFELTRKRWNLACTDTFESPPSFQQQYPAPVLKNLLSDPPAGLSLTTVDRLSLSKDFLKNFKAYSSAALETRETEPSGKLYGYGTDGFGTYIPLHLLWPGLKNHWGIYISESGVLGLAASLYQALLSGYKFSTPDAEIQKTSLLIQIAYQVILRHQLFHFKIEQWSLLFEFATGRPYYLPYLQNVYLPTIYDERDENLEEALANLSIMLSKKIQKLEKELELDVSGFIKSEFLYNQGPNYRNFDLNRGVPSYIEKYDRELRYREVVNFLCNQIIQGELNPLYPMIPYYLYPPNNNFLRAESLCPIYLVRNLPCQVGVIA